MVMGASSSGAPALAERSARLALGRGLLLLGPLALKFVETRSLRRHSASTLLNGRGQDLAPGKSRPDADNGRQRDKEDQPTPWLSVIGAGRAGEGGLAEWL
jgi:hypothetical protein